MANITMSSTWDGAFKGKGTIVGDGWELTIGIPADLGGSGAGANPKEIFTAATLACFTATLNAILANKHIPTASVAVDTTAEANDDSFAIRHVAHVVLADDAKDEHVAAAQNAVQTADKVCIVGNLAKKAGVTIEVEADIQSH